VERQRPGEHLRPDHLVERVVPADILAEHEQLAARREQARRVQPARLLEGALGPAKRIGQGQQQRARDYRAAERDRVAADGELVERRLAADSARRGCDEVALGDARRIERLREPHDHRVIGLVERRRVAGLNRNHLRAFDQAFGPQEPDRQFVLEPRGSHRDSHRDGVLARSGGPDLEWLLAHDPVCADFEGVAADGHDPGSRHVPRWWQSRRVLGSLGHGA
jgi:hypothetical protein